MPARLANPALTRLVFLAAASTLLLGGQAMASPIVVLNDGEYKGTVISRGDFFVHLFAHEVILEPFIPTVYPSSHSLAISFGYSLGQVAGSIGGNSLPDWPSLPVQTPALLSQGGLKLKDQFIDASWGFAEPQYDPTSGGTNVASISHGTSPFSDFNLNTFENAGDMAYIGYASSDFSIFGYMQIERVTEVDWKLIGYAYDTSGEGILVQNLVPAPGALALALLAALPRRRGRTPSDR